MSWYWGSWGAVLMSVFVSYLCSFFKKRRSSYIYTITKFIMIILPILLYAGFRYGIGIDYWSYKNRYDSWSYGDNQYSVLFSRLHDLFYLLKLDYEYFIFAISLAFLAITLLVVFSLSPSITWSLFLFMGCNLYFETMTVFKQSLALALTLYSLKYLTLNKNIICILLIFIAVGFHTSSIIFLFVLLIKKYPVNFKLQLLLLSILCVVSNNIEVLFRPIIINTEYAYYYDSIFYDPNKTLYFYKFYNTIVYLFMLLSTRYLKGKNSYMIENIELFLNIQFLATCLIFTSGAIPEVHRLNYYFIFPSIIGIPLVLNELNKFLRKGTLLFIKLGVVLFTMSYTIYLNISNGYVNIEYDNIIYYLF